MTQEEKNNHLTRFQRFQQSREVHFAPKIDAALHQQYLQFIKYRDVHKIDSSGIITVIRDLYLDAGIVYGAKIRADFNKMGAYKKQMETKNRRPIGFSERMQELLNQYFTFDILNTSEGITKKTRELITKVLSDAYAQGLGIDDIISQLKDTELSKIRARLIARTETVTAANKGALFVATDTGLLLNKTWLATEDARTRTDHSNHGGVDGQTIGRDDYFKVGGYEMLHPGDRGGHDGRPAVPPSETCNCRCTVIFRPVRDANGRLIRMAPVDNSLVA